MTEGRQVPGYYVTSITFAVLKWCLDLMIFTARLWIDEPNQMRWMIASI